MSVIFKNKDLDYDYVRYNYDKHCKDQSGESESIVQSLDSITTTTTTTTTTEEGSDGPIMVLTTVKTTTIISEEKEAMKITTITETTITKTVSNKIITTTKSESTTTTVITHGVTITTPSTIINTITPNPQNSIKSETSSITTTSSNSDANGSRTKSVITTFKDNDMFVDNCPTLKGYFDTTKNICSTTKNDGTVTYSCPSLNENGAYHCDSVVSDVNTNTGVINSNPSISTTTKSSTPTPTVDPNDIIYNIKNANSCIGYSTRSEVGGTTSNITINPCGNFTDEKWYIRNNKIVSYQLNKCIGIFYSSVSFIDCNRATSNDIKFFSYNSNDNTICTFDNYCLYDRGYATKDIKNMGNRAIWELVAV